MARAAPDGYTFGIASPASHTVPVSLGKKLPYDPVKDFTPLALLVKNPLVIVVNASLPVKTLKETSRPIAKHGPATTHACHGSSLWVLQACRPPLPSGSPAQ